MWQIWEQKVPSSQICLITFPSAGLGGRNRVEANLQSRHTKSPKMPPHFPFRWVWRKRRGCRFAAAPPEWTYLFIDTCDRKDIPTPSAAYPARVYPFHSYSTANRYSPACLNTGGCSVWTHGTLMYTAYIYIYTNIYISVYTYIYVYIYVCKQYIYI